MQTADLYHDWGNKFDLSDRVIGVFDTTLRDGLQSPHVRVQPTLAQKMSFIDAVASVGIDAIEIGFPISSPGHKNDVIELAKHVARNRYPITLSCLARTTEMDVQAIVDVAQSSGVAVTANVVLGSSRVRQLVENWNLDQMLVWVEKSLSVAKTNNLEVEFVTEDGTRSRPEDLKRLYCHAVDLGARRIWIADTVGVATPHSTNRIVKFFKTEITGNRIGLDWHGHDDKGLGVSNALQALISGADRVQGTALGIGERSGNTPLEPVIANIAVGNSCRYDLTKLGDYSRAASQMCGVEIRGGYPGIGEYSHATASGMHAAAILKARQMAREDLVGNVYGPWHPNIFGQDVKIFVGALSGRSNAIWNLRRLGLPDSEVVADAVLALAKQENRILSDSDITNLVKDLHF